MSTVSDYIGRKIDVAAYTPSSETGVGLLVQDLALPGEGGLVIAGIQKLAQRFLLELLTEQGSMKYLPLRGSSFMTEIRSGTVRTHIDLFAVFSRAEVDIRRNLTDDELDTDPDDERYDSATVLSASVEAGAATLSIALLSLAGTGREYIFPLRVSL